MEESFDLHKQRFLLCGIRVDALRRHDLLHIVRNSIEQRQKCLVLSHNLHSLYIYETLPDFKSFYQRADCVYIDGMPVVWMGKAAGLPFKSEHRITLLDSMEAVMSEAAANGWSVFYLGGTEEILRAGLEKLTTQFPDLQITGRNGYFDIERDSAAVVDQINILQPDMLFVGLGMPLQERWLATYYAQLQVPAVLTCGATLSYITEHSYRPPPWASKLGLYGLMRLLHEPKRLWRRYLMEPLYLLRRLGGGIVKQRLRGSGAAD
jgi:N-acetylglucosaminyldiphosphoundecaprenol N-acetyl-beta-D-mannosaminyltransferase